MEIIPKVGIGPLRFGMTPDQVRALFSEHETYEDWMVRNLNDSILYRGFIMGFDLCGPWGPFNEASMQKYARAASDPKTVEWYEAGHDLNDVQALIDRANWLQTQIGIKLVGPILQRKLGAIK